MSLAKFTLKERDFIWVTQRSHFSLSFTSNLALSFPGIGLHCNSAYHKTIWFKIHSLIVLDHSSQEKQPNSCEKHKETLSTG